MNSVLKPIVFAYVPVVAALLLAGTIHAATVTGAIYENNVNGSQDAIPSNVPSGTPDVTFTTSSPINFASGNAYTIGEFLNSGTGSTVLTGSSELGNTLNNTLFNFVGTVSVVNGETFTAGHDDGLTLVIDGITVISAPFGTSYALTTNTYTGPTGNYAFQLVYGEAFGTPGDLTVDLPFQSSTTPEPSSFLLIGAGLLGLGTGLKYKLRSEV